MNDAGKWYLYTERRDSDHEWHAFSKAYPAELEREMVRLAPKIPTVADLAALVRAFLAADSEARSEPCMHRFRGIVRRREVARRWRLQRAAREALDEALSRVPASQEKP